MIDLCSKFSELNRNIKDFQSPVDTLGAIKAYYGVSVDGNFMISFLSTKSTGIRGTTKSVDVVQGKSNDETYWTCFNLKNDDLLAVFCTFGEDLISSISGEKSESIAASKLRFRFNTWVALFRKNRMPLSVEKAKGLYGELLFLSKFMFEKYGVDRSIEAWSGPENYSKDFAIDNYWYEVKTIGTHSTTVKISSIQQLSSEIEGKLIVIKVEEMAETYTGSDSSINELIQKIITMIHSNDLKDLFLEKITNYGYDLCDDIGNKKYQFSKIEKYVVNKDFPVLKESDIKLMAINNVSYELILKSISDFLEVE